MKISNRPTRILAASRLWLRVSSSEIATTWQRGMSAMNAINSDKTIDYKVFDPSFLAGGSGGQIQNSNSAIYTLGRAMKANRGGASMPFHRKCGLVGMLRIFLVFGLSACERDYWPQRTWVTNAAENDSKRLSDEALRYEKPFDT